MNIRKVLGNRILVEDVGIEYNGAIALPHNYKMQQLKRGKILKLGTKVREELSVGDIVVFEGVYGKDINKEETQRILDVGCLKAKIS